MVRNVFSMTVTIKQRPEAWEGGSSPHVERRAVQVGRNEDTKALKLESAFVEFMVPCFFKFQKGNLCLQSAKTEFFTIKCNYHLTL